MFCSTYTLLSFWATPWSETLRGACIWLARMGQPITAHRPDAEAPPWLRPLCVQRWVGQAIAARLAWVGERTDEAVYRFGHESEPCWTEVAWMSYDRQCLRELSEKSVIWLFGVEVERLLRVAQEAPALVGDADWTRAALGASEHVAQLYGELKRRYKAMQARAILREDLRVFLAWARPGTTGDV
jgi:hypothetical protein